MRDSRVLTYALGISVAAHLAAICIIGGTSAARLNTATATAAALPRLIKVDLVDEPKAPARQPATVPSFLKPTPEQHPASNTILPMPDAPTADVSNPLPTRVLNPHSAASTNRVPGNPGGRLNIGALSSHGDLAGNWTGGKTPTGWVPGADEGHGKGSGSGVGVGTPDPPKHADEGPGTRPAPAPAAPRTVSVRICAVSGMLAGENCKETRTESFVEGHEPGHACDRCKPPEHHSRLADRFEPVLVSDSRPSIPSSVEEGLNVRVEVGYTVTADGDVSGVEIIKSSGNKLVDRAVVNAAQRLKYKPAVQDGVARGVKKTRTYFINT